MKNLIAIVVAVVSFTCLNAQGEWNWLSKTYNRNLQDSVGLVWGHFDYQMGSTSLSNGLLREAVFEGVINTETAISTTDNFNREDARTGGYAEGELWFKSNGGAWSLLVGTGFKEMFGAHTSTDLLRLYLRGNAPYAEEELNLGPSKVFNQSSQFIGFGFERSGKSSRFGLTANLHKIGRYQQADVETGTLYTAAYGEYVESDLNLIYETAGSKQDKLSAWYGTGVTINAYWSIDFGVDDHIYMKVKDLGVMQFAGLNRATLDTNYFFQGAEIENILQLDDSLFQDAELDSLEALLGLSISNEQTSRIAPGYFVFGVNKNFSDKLGIVLEVRQFWRSGAAMEGRLTLPWHVSEKFTMEPGVRLGGWSGFTTGVNVAFHPSERFLMVLKTEQFQSLLLPEGRSGQRLMIGAMLNF